MKKNKKIFITSIFLIIVAVVLIIISFVVEVGERNNNHPNSDNDSVNDTNSGLDLEKTTIYSCRKMLDKDSDNYSSYQVETLYVLNDIVLHSNPTMEIHCDTEEIYLTFKNDKDYSQGKVFDDEKRIVTFANGNPIDLTKDADGKDLKLKYFDYQQSLVKVGYTCVQE